jgi:hypothetical protein
MDDRLPYAVTLWPVPKTSMSFDDFDEYERIVLAAGGLDATAHLIVPLAGEAAVGAARCSCSNGTMSISASGRSASSGLTGTAR